MGVASSTPQIVIVGLGPGSLSLMTREAEETLLAADRVLFRTVHPACDWLRERGRAVYCFNLLYDTPGITYEDVYAFVVEAVVREAELRGRAVYAVPGHPFVLEHAALMLADRAKSLGFDLRIVSGMSYIDLVCTELRLDPTSGLQLCDALDFVGGEPNVGAHAGLLIAQLSVRDALAASERGSVVERVAAWLTGRFPQDHPVSLVWTTGAPEYATRSQTVSLRDLVSACAGLKQAGLVPTAYVPPARRASGLSTP